PAGARRASAQGGKMVDKSKMSVADILAAARKADAKGGAPADAPAAETAPAQPESEESSSHVEPAPVAAKPAAPAPVAKTPGGARPSVAEMLAMARGEKSAAPAAAPPAAKAKEKPAVKPAAVKSAAPAATAAPAKKDGAAAKAAPLDTQSILTAARKGAKPGPMTKAEAAAKAAPAAPDVKKAKAKEAIVVPPMPVKPDYAKPAPAKSAKEAVAERRAFIFGMSALAIGFGSLTATAVAWTLGSVRFMFPNILREPPSRFTVGTPDKFPPGQVDERFKASNGVWIVNAEYNGQQQIFALKSVCTHLGCTPNWLEAEQKFKCPCHGSGFYKDGINFEGPAPRPLERYAISKAPNGEIEVDKGRIYQEEMGQWADPTSYIQV
ncbi:MAG TPA: ubiquinol-cytochrome c reductase iron-sulfur subunit, partial [Lacipirellulaceae bacterium]